MGIFCIFILIAICASSSGNKTYRNTNYNTKAYYGRMGARLGRKVGRMKW